MLAPACAQQRSLVAVRESGERAYAFEQYDQALADFQEYVDRFPGDPVGHYNLGRAYLKVTPARPVAAREQLLIAYSQRPTNDEYCEALCEAYAAAKQNEELYKLLRSRALDRQQVADYMRLARYARQLGDADEAKQALLTAARIDGGQSADLQLALADFYASVNDKAEAVRRLRMAFFLDPTNTTIQSRMQTMGVVAGPTFALRPDEMP
jgi:predicted Zn-dependent protease